MKYAQPNGLAQARARKRRRSIIVMVVVALLVIAGAAYAAAYAGGLIPGSRPAPLPASCSPTTTIPPNSGFPVNVYNASTGQGKAKETAKALKSRQFSVSVVSNDPYSMKLTGVGQIRFGPRGVANAKKWIQPLFPNATLLQDGRDDASVDVVTGDQFPTLSEVTQPTVTTPAGC
ncbi:LytR C-terminal domain-containing protein [Calidifontibacter terrae]